MVKESVFPVNVQLWVRFLDGDGALLRDMPFRYTVKHARHWGLLKKSLRYTGRRSMSSPTNKHFDKYASVIANITFNYFKDIDWVTIQIVGPNLMNEHKQEDIYAAKHIHLYMLNTIKYRHKDKSFYALSGVMHKILRRALVLFVDTYLSKVGYKSQPRPRKYLHEKRKEWRRYKGLTEALVTKREAYIDIDREYRESLFNIKILPEVLRYANKARIFWTVNTPEQALEAQLLHANSSITTRSEELEELEL